MTKDEAQHRRWTFCEAVKSVRKNSAYKHLCFVMVTAEGTTEYPEQAMKAGANHYLNKPFDAQGMKDLIVNYAANA